MPQPAIQPKNKMDQNPPSTNSSDVSVAGSGKSGSSTTRIPSPPSRADLSHILQKAESDAPHEHCLEWYLEPGSKLRLSVLFKDAMDEIPLWRLIRSSEDLDSELFQFSSLNPDEVLIKLARSDRESSAEGVESGNGQESSKPVTIVIDKGLMTLPPDSVFAGRYRIIGSLGEGGMGKVYHVSDLSQNRSAALKVLHPHLMEDECARMRFAREARATVELTHPHFLSGYDFGVSEKESLPYIAMELLEGESLNTVINLDGPLELERFFAIFQQVCAALQHAHSMKMIHRDVKPSNIMLIRTDFTNEHVKLMDFGIAKFISTGLEKTDQEVTRGGDVYGSPSYMSPEQCLGKALDNRSDIYSLGCVMYEAVTGTRAFDSTNPLTIMEMHVSHKPKPFAIVCPELSIPEKLEALIMRALEKEPEKRFSSAHEINQQLEELKQSSACAMRVLDSSLSEAAQTAKRMLELLKKCELISGHSLAYARRILKEENVDIASYLSEKCGISKETVLATGECQKRVENGTLSLEFAVIAIHYCHKNALSLEESLRQLGLGPGQ